MPPVVVASLPGATLAAATRRTSLGPVLSRCPRYLSRGNVAALAGNSTVDAALGDCFLSDVGRDRDVYGALVRWEPKGLRRLSHPVRWFLRLSVWLCASFVDVCLMTATERNAWSDLEAFDAILGNYDRPNNVFIRDRATLRALAPIDHNHVTANLTTARTTWKWCDHSRVVAAFLADPRGPAPFATVKAAIEADAGPDTARALKRDLLRFRAMDKNAAAYAAFVRGPRCRRRRRRGGSELVDPSHRRRLLKARGDLDLVLGIDLRA